MRLVRRSAPNACDLEEPTATGATVLLPAQCLGESRAAPHQPVAKRFFAYGSPQSFSSNPRIWSLCHPKRKRNFHARLGTHEYENWALSSKYLFKISNSLNYETSNKGDVFLEDFDIPEKETALSNS